MSVELIAIIVIQIVTLITHALSTIKKSECASNECFKCTTTFKDDNSSDSSSDSSDSDSSSSS